MKGIKFFNNIYVKNILAAIIVVILLMFGTFKWLDIYTKHGKAVIVPDVRGLQEAQAAPFFESNSMRYTVVDSVYNASAAPGCIMETIPHAGTKVKEGRNILVTINAYAPRKLIVPEVKDRSLRQALSMLRAAGFHNVSLEYVPASFKDLVISLNLGIETVYGGDRLPANSKLVLKVGNGNLENTPLSDDNTYSNTESSDESWF